MAEGLQYLHDNDIIHGNLTLVRLLVVLFVPELKRSQKSILVDDSGAAQLRDFGLTQLAEWQQPIESTEASIFSGRDRYTAPELSHAPLAAATFESDVYSVGCVLLKVRR